MNLHVSSTVSTSSNYVDQALVAHNPHAEPGYILVNMNIVYNKLGFHCHHYQV